ncbi:MAG: DinB family protein [Dehalococcoidia bacterium]
MDLREYIKGQHGGIRTIFQTSILSGLTPDQLTQRPSPYANSIAWLAWHCARTEDVAMNTVVRGVDQVFASSGWGEKLGVALSDIGTSMGDEEAAQFMQQVDAPAVLDYWAAVQAETRNWLKTADVSRLEDVPDLTARLKAAPPALAPGAGWVQSLWSGKPVAFFVNWVAIGHEYVHLGEMTTTRSALGLRGL